MLAAVADAEEGEAIHRKHCEAVHTVPLLDAVTAAGLTEADTEGPDGGGGVNHAHTIRMLGRRVVDLQTRLDRFIRQCNAQMGKDGTVGDPQILVELLRGGIEGSDLTDRIEQEWRTRLGKMRSELDAALERIDEFKASALIGEDSSSVTPGVITAEVTRLRAEVETLKQTHADYRAAIDAGTEERLRGEVASLEKLIGEATTHGLAVGAAVRFREDPKHRGTLECLGEPEGVTHRGIKLKDQARIRRDAGDPLFAAAPCWWAPLNCLAPLDEKDRAMHPDDYAVCNFAAAMREKLAKKRAEGRGGWDSSECTAATLSAMLRDHVEKGDSVDVGNLAMMLKQRGERITGRPLQKQYDDAVDALVMVIGFAESRVEDIAEEQSWPVSMNPVATLLHDTGKPPDEVVDAVNRIRAAQAVLAEAGR